MSLSSGLIPDSRGGAPRANLPALAADAALLGKYVLRRELGRGGMGIVYEGEDTLLERPVAIKLLAPHCADAAALGRLLREARSAARLNHPHAVAVYDAGEHPLGVYIAMELVRGASAYESLQRCGPFRWQDAARIVAEVCHGLAAAHAAGLIHRDIKPANIMLVEAAGPAVCQPARNAAGQESLPSQPWAKLADFGLSRSLSHTAPVTMEGQVVGTPHYMSPEQIRGERLDERSDIYSLGATFYTLLTGRFPFERDDIIQILFAHCSAAPPDPAILVPGLPAACSAIIARTLAKEPRERYASAEALLGDLLSLLAGEHESLGLAPHLVRRPGAETISTARTQFDLRPLSIRLPPTPPPKHWPWSAIGVAIVMLFALLVAGALRQWPQAGKQPIHAQETHLPPIANRSPIKRVWPALAPVGMRIERPWGNDRDGEILLAGEMELLRLAPDGQTLALGISEGDAQTGRLLLFDIERREVVGMHTDDTRYASFSDVAFPSERFVLLACSSQVVAWDRETGRVTQLVQLDDGSAYSIDVSPSGDRLALGVVEWDHGGRVEVYDLSLDPQSPRATGRRTINRAHTRPVKCVAYSPDGKYIASSSEDGSVLIGDAENCQTLHQGALPQPVGEWADVGYAVAFSPDSNLVAAGGHTGVVLWDVATGTRRVLPEEHSRGIMALAFSHDGAFIASGCTDGVRIWNVNKGWQVGQTLEGHAGNVISGLAFANHDELLISAGFDRRVRFWGLAPLSRSSTTP